MSKTMIAGFALLVSLAALIVSLDAAPVPTPLLPEHKTYTETIPGTKVTFRMVAIPGGEFHMGSPDSEKGRNADEGPRHPVAIRPFWMGACEATWDEFDVYWKEKPAEVNVPKPGEKKKPGEDDHDAITRPTEPYVDETWGHGREGYPVLGIGRHAAMEYCRWLSRKTGKRYRLPTEAEWEYACRAGTKTPWSHGDDPQKLHQYAWFKDNSSELTHPVGKKKPNPWGLYDMHGNLGEWCIDGYQPDRYSRLSLDTATLSPVFLPGPERSPHVVRGGSWLDTADRCRSAARLASDKKWNRCDPDLHKSLWWLTNGEFVGFRIVRAVEEQKVLIDIRSKVDKESRD